MLGRLNSFTDGYSSLHSSEDEYEDFIVDEFDRETESTEQDSTITTIASYAWAPFSYTVVPLTNYVWSCLSDFLIDGDHPCKQAKYVCVLEQILEQLDPSLLELAEQDPESLTPLEKRLADIAAHLLKDSSEFYDRSRTQHRQFIEKLREALSSELYQQIYHEEGPEVQSLHQIAASVYNVPLHSFIASVICGVIEKGYGSDKVDDIMALSLPEQRQAIINLPQADKAPLFNLWVNKLKGHTGCYFDPHTMGNIPHILFDLIFKDRSIRFVRTGTPTIDEWNTRIAPEFLAFLRHCVSTDKKLMYFNLQAAAGGAESSRCKLLKKVFEDEEMENSLFMLNHDTEFYLQSGVWEEEEDAERFKKSLIHQLCTDPSFWIPVDYQNDKKFLKLTRQVFDDLHQDVFHGKKKMSREERQDFLDIAYSLFIFTCACYEQPETIMVCCKDALDRAGLRIYILLYLVMIFKNQLDEDAMKNLMVTAMGPPFLMKKQEIIEERFERLNRCRIRLSDEAVIHNLQQRAKDRGYADSIGYKMHPVEKQVFHMSAGDFEYKLDTPSQDSLFSL